MLTAVGIDTRGLLATALLLCTRGLASQDH
jgi:hypothetical protein